MKKFIGHRIPAWIVGLFVALTALVSYIYGTITPKSGNLTDAQATLKAAVIVAFCGIGGSFLSSLMASQSALDASREQFNLESAERAKTREEEYKQRDIEFNRDAQERQRKELQHWWETYGIENGITPILNYLQIIIHRCLPAKDSAAVGKLPDIPRPALARMEMFLGPSPLTRLVLIADTVTALSCSRAVRKISQELYDKLYDDLSKFQHHLLNYVPESKGEIYNLRNDIQAKLLVELLRFYETTYAYKLIVIDDETSPFSKAEKESLALIRKHRDEMLAAQEITA